MEITERQKKAGRKVVEVGHLMQLAIREAVSEGLVVNAGYASYSEPNAEFRVVVKIEQETLVATTEGNDKK